MEYESMSDIPRLSFSDLSDLSIRTDLMPLPNETLSEIDGLPGNIDNIPLFDEVCNHDKELSTLFTEQELYTFVSISDNS